MIRFVDKKKISIVNLKIKAEFSCPEVLNKDNEDYNFFSKLFYSYFKEKDLEKVYLDSQCKFLKKTTIPYHNNENKLQAALESYYESLEILKVDFYYYPKDAKLKTFSTSESIIIYFNIQELPKRIKQKINLAKKINDFTY